MRYLLHHTDATYDSTSKRWFYNLDRRVSNPTAIVVSSCTYTAAAASSYPSVVYMRSDAIVAITKTKHTV